jgi:hypothetical protein
VRRKHYIQNLLMCAVLTALPAVAQAQQTPQSVMPKAQNQTQQIDPHRKTFIDDPRYRQMARDVVTRPKAFNFNGFRYTYAGTTQYDPLGDTAREWLLKLAYIAQNDKDPAKRDKALLNYGEVLSLHLANLDAVTQALVLAQQDRRFGDPEFLQWLRYGLVNSVTSAGNGSSIFRAYEIITIGEEAALLRQLNVQVLDTKSEESGGTWYNMHTVNDGVHEPYTIFTNLSVPMKFLETKGKAAGANISIPRQ